MSKHIYRSSFALLFCLGAVAGCGKSTVEGVDGHKLTLVKPVDQTVKQGATEKVAVAILRRGFDNPVEIEVDDLPKGVTVSGGRTATIPTGALKLDVTLVAAADAPLVRDHRVSVTAKGPGGIAVTEFFKLDVTTNQ